MKNIITLLLIISSKISLAQIDQQNILLSSLLKENFPYGSGVVTEQNCDSLFTGAFYISFKIADSGRCFDIEFYGIKNFKVRSVFTSLLKQKNFYFTSSFATLMSNKILYQPVYYSLNSCANDTSIKLRNFTNLNDQESEMYLEALKLISRQNQRLSKSFETGFPFPMSKGYFNGIMLTPCVIDADPKLKKRKTL